MSINERGYWEGLEASDQHCYDNILSTSLLDFFKNENAESIVDLGCGLGDYVKHLKNNGLNIDGFDGNPNTIELTNGLCNIKDLSEPFIFDKKYEWVLSLEVGEHLPKKFEDTFINNLHNNNLRGIVMSWAIKGQGGHGHFNEQNNDYIKQIFAGLGYTNDINAENKIRTNCKLWWFKNTIMVFRK